MRRVDFVGASAWTVDGAEAHRFSLRGCAAVEDLQDLNRVAPILRVGRLIEPDHDLDVIEPRIRKLVNPY